MASACYVYAIVGRDTPLPADGCGAQLTTVPWRALAAVTGPIAQDGGRLTVEAVLRHEAVVEAVRQQGSALPVRFGTVFRDATSVASALAERYESLEADLDRLGDKVELCLTALWAAPAPDGAYAAARDVTSGTRYLQARAAELRRDEALKERARAVARDVDEVLGPLALEWRTSLLPTPRIAVRSAYLLDRAGVSAFKAAFEALRGTRRELRVLLTGPWPPYSFVGRSEGASDDCLTRLARLLTGVMEERRD